MCLGTFGRLARSLATIYIFPQCTKNLCLDAPRRVRAEIFISVDSSVFLDFFHLRPDRMNNHLHALLFL